MGGFGPGDTGRKNRDLRLFVTQRAAGPRNPGLADLNVGLRPDQGRLRAVAPRLEQMGIETGDGLVALDLVIEVDQHLLDAARDL